MEIPNVTGYTQYIQVKEYQDAWYTCTGMYIISKSEDGEYHA